MMSSKDSPQVSQTGSDQGEEGSVASTNSETHANTPNSENCDSEHNFSGHEDTDADTQFWNPEPQKDLLEKYKDLTEADSIGDTVFSKHSLISTLVKLIQAVDSETEAKDSPSGTEAGIDLDDGLQDELCKIWDMAMNPDVANCLYDLKSVDILMGVMAKSRAPRATEICAGIIGNMACNADVCKQLSDNKKLINLTVMLLGNPDAPTLVETTRLTQVAVSTEGCATKWLQVIKSDSATLTNLCFILASSTNNDLIKNTVELVDRLMDTDTELCESWSGAGLLHAVIEASKQCEQSDTKDGLLHILQSMSTTQDGHEALVEEGESVVSVAQQYLVSQCGEELVIIQGKEGTLASVMSVLSSLLPAWLGKTAYLNTEYQLLRSVIKVLDTALPIVNPKYKKPRRHRHASTHRRKSMSRLSDDRKSAESEPQTQCTETSEGEAMTAGAEVTREETNLNLVTMVIGDSKLILTEIIQTVTQDCDSENKEVPKCLEYLDSTCPRNRIELLCEVLQETHNERETSNNNSDKNCLDSSDSAMHIDSDTEPKTEDTEAKAENIESKTEVSNENLTAQNRNGTDNVEERTSLLDLLNNSANKFKLTRLADSLKVYTS